MRITVDSYEWKWELTGHSSDWSEDDWLRNGHCGSEDTANVDIDHRRDELRLGEIQRHAISAVPIQAISVDKYTTKIALTLDRKE